MQAKQVHRLFKVSALSMGLFSAYSHAAVDCSSIADWQSGKVYVKGEQVQSQQQAFEAKWWNRSNPVEKSGPWQEWKKLGECGASTPENQLPTVVWLSETQNLTAVENDSVIFSIDAKDSDGEVKQVEFFVDQTRVATVNSAPYNFNWTAKIGSHQVHAIATDNQGGQTQSKTVAINVSAKDQPPVNKAPEVKLTIVSIPAKLVPGEKVTFALSANDSDGLVKGLALFVNDQRVFESSQSQANFSWTASELGRFDFVLKATDDKGAVSQASQVLNVVEKDTPVDGNDACRPAGLYQTPGVNTPYCTVYDTEGREVMGADHPRRVIGYFTSWRTGKNGQPDYLVNDIPWDKITHINYAFAHVNSENEISVGENNPGNAATDMEWPGEVGAEMDPSLPYKGHFNLLNKYKKQYPHVKTFVSVGGWAETGGYFDATGKRVNSGGFYTMTTNADGSVNHEGIAKFVKSSVAFMKKYGFDGLDIDYEYPSSMNDSGHPDDFEFSNARRAGLNKSYQVLMKELREALDREGEKDGQHYMLTIASPSSGYLLRGMETFQVAKYLDYVNIMSYDLHGAWNDHVGHNAPLYDTGKDSELKAWNVYNTKEFQGIGYLNTDWAVTYFRGAMSAGRINIGVPYYTRGFKDVRGGENGLWGRAPYPNQSNCPKGTGKGEKNKCGNGAIGIDNLWHDKEDGQEVAAGSNPMWHAKNLENGIVPSYLSVYGLTPETDPDDVLTGKYQRHYDDVAVAPWLWNADKNVFISIEDEQSMGTKIDYIIDKGLGGVMFWEMAGDYDFDAKKGEYFMGSTLTRLAYDKFNQAGTAYDVNQGSKHFVLPESVVDVTFEAKNFLVGDQNYPIAPTFSFTNNSDLDLTGAVISFDVPVSTSAIFKSNWNAQKKLGMAVVQDGSNTAGNNIGGFENEFHRFSITLKNQWGGKAEAFGPGQTVNADVMYYMPITGPVNFTIEKDGQIYGVKYEYPHLPVAEKPADGGGSGGGNGGGNGQSCQGVEVSNIKVYPNWPQTDWQGNPSHATGGDMLVHNKAVWKAKWWTRSEPGSGGVWEKVCSL